MRKVTAALLAASVFIVAVLLGAVEAAVWFVLLAVGWFVAAMGRAAARGDRS